MKDIYDWLNKLEDMCNRNPYRSITIEYKHIYDMKKMIEDIPDTIKMLREDKEQLQTENAKLKQDNQELKRIVEAYKDKKYKIIHKIQLWQMDGEITIRDLQDILQILNDKVVE